MPIYNNEKYLADCIESVLNQNFKDLEGLYTMRTLGRNMAFLLKGIAQQKAENGLPEKEPRVATNFIR